MSRVDGAAPRAGNKQPHCARARRVTQPVGAVRDSQVTVLSQACRAASAWWKAGCGLSNACPAPAYVSTVAAAGPVVSARSILKGASSESRPMSRADVGVA